MNIQSRSRNSVRNMFYGIISHAVTMILQFVSRTIFIYFLGSEYLGVNGLYGNVLNVLSLAELGIDSVMLFSLYKPVADNNKNEIVALLNYYKKIYYRIAILVLVIGTALIPFLRFLIQSELEQSKLILYYVLFLLNSVVSYFVIYKSALIKADQRTYIINNNSTIFTIIRHIAQTVFLVLTKNYIIYLSIQVLCTIISNIALSKKADRLYPFIKTNSNKASTKITTISRDIKYAFVYRLSNILIGNTDNILISAIIGTVYVGYYSNYSMFIFNVSVIINMLVTSILPSFGNLYASSDHKKMYDMFSVTVLFFNWISIVCSLCFYMVFNDFISIWIGKEYVFSNAIVFIIVLNFYTEIILKPMWLYREVMGLFKEVRFIRLYAAIINLCLSVILGKLFGIIGILIATFIASVLTFAWYEPMIICKEMKISSKKYFINQIKFIMLAAISFVICLFLCRLLGHTILDIVIKLSISVFIPSIVFLACVFKTKEWKYLRGCITKTIRRKNSL